MKRFDIFIWITLCVYLFIPFSINAQSLQLKLTLSRDWGYGGFNNDIQGLFSMHISEMDGLRKVEFFIDDILIAEDLQAPYTIQISTEAYPLGLHTMSAIGTNLDGLAIESNKIVVNFVEASESSAAAARIIVPVIGVILLAILISAGISITTNRNKKESLPYGEKRKYGIAGGGICKRCQRPFSLHIWGLNLGFSKLDRCPYCGNWSIIRAQSLSKLRDAELAELAWSRTSVNEETEEEKYIREVNDSKFQ